MAERIHTHVGDAALDAAEAQRFVASPKNGAHIVFLGVVRDHDHGREVVAVSYDAEPALAACTLNEIAQTAIAGETHARIFVAHRTGRLTVGETSVVIAVSSPHRAFAYDASRAIIEAIKKRLPVWKKEHYIGGDSEWLDGCCLLEEE